LKWRKILLKNKVPLVFAVSSKCFWKSLFKFSFTREYKSEKGTLLIEFMPSVIALLARISASSFPTIPTCEGIQRNWIRIPRASASSNLDLIKGVTLVFPPADAQSSQGQFWKGRRVGKRENGRVNDVTVSGFIKKYLI